VCKAKANNGRSHVERALMIKRGGQSKCLAARATRAFSASYTWQTIQVCRPASEIEILSPTFFLKFLHSHEAPWKLTTSINHSITNGGISIAFVLRERAVT
jgi:hypothetical protein